jgi:uncharacterized membrane protein
LGIEAVAQTLGHHFPQHGLRINELPDEPAMLP